MPEKVLIIDDNDKNRLLMVDVLKYQGYEIIEATNGEEGIRMAKENRPDLILMDIHMPVMDGYKAIKILKDDPATKKIKIIAVTSFAMKGDREKALSSGADDYIPKPIDTRKLPEIVKRLLRKDVS